MLGFLFSAVVAMAPYAGRDLFNYTKDKRKEKV